VVDNYKLRELLERARKSKKRRMIQYEDADHKCLSDGELITLILQDLVQFIQENID
jgi:hypothetical protein